MKSASAASQPFFSTLRPRAAVVVLGFGLLLGPGCIKRELEHKARGNVLFHHGDIPGAIAEYKQALALSPNDVGAQTLLGNALFEQGSYPEAIHAFEAALARDPGAREARRGLASCQLRLGQIEQAEKSFLRVLDVAPADYEAHAALGKLQLNRRDLDGAISHLGEALRWVQNDPPTLYAFGLALARKGEQARALAVFEQLEAVAPKAPFAAYGRAQTLALAGRKDEALTWLDRALQRGVPKLEEVSVDPDLAALRDDARFAAMLSAAQKRLPTPSQPPAQAKPR